MWLLETMFLIERALTLGEKLDFGIMHSTSTPFPNHLSYPLARMVGGVTAPITAIDLIPWLLIKFIQNSIVYKNMLPEITSHKYPLGPSCREPFLEVVAAPF